MVSLLSIWPFIIHTREMISWVNPESL